jgi:hypothetical protein
MPLQAWGISKDIIWLLQVAALQKEIADIDKQVAEAEHMLRFADPGECLHAEAMPIWIQLIALCMPVVRRRSRPRHCLMV